MVDKASVLELESSRQAGADDDLRTHFPELNVPQGLTLADLEAAEDMVLEWENNGEYRAFALVLRVFEHLTAAVQAAQRGLVRAE